MMRAKAGPRTLDKGEDEKYHLKMKSRNTLLYLLGGAGALIVRISSVLRAHLCYPLITDVFVVQK